MVGLVFAALISLAWAAASLWIGPATGWVDAPDNPDLKVHEQAAVPLGGVGIFLGVHVALVAANSFDAGLLAASALVLVLGLADDRFGLSPGLRLAVEVGAGVSLLLFANVGVSGWLGLVVGTLLVVVAINAVNLYDGLDGLVGATALVAALGIAWLTEAQVFGDGSFGFALAGALVGFLVLNWSPAKVFLGDNGAYLVGIFIVYGILRVDDAKEAVTVALVSPPMVPATVWIAMGLLGVFAIDLFVTLIRRAAQESAMFEGDRSHTYDQLRDRGYGVKQVALISAAVQSVLVVTVIVADRVFGGWIGVILMGVVASGCIAAARHFGFLLVDEVPD